MENIKTLIFDLGGVLINLDIPRFQQAFRDMGLSQVDEWMLHGKLKPLFQGYELGTVTTQEFLETLQRECPVPVTCSQIREAWNLMCADIPEEKLEMLLKLHRHYSIFLLSNTNELHWLATARKCFEKDGHRVSDYFDRVFLSYEMHDYKPYRSIFETVMEETGIDPAKTLFLDDRAENVKGAEDVGLKGMLEEPYRQDERGLFHKPACCWTDALKKLLPPESR